jgi:hypothetical protein
LVPGTGGLYVEADGRFHIWLNAANLDDPGGLVATMAHELGHVLLLGHRRISLDEPDHEPLTDLLTVFFGLGVITANAVVHEESWSSGTLSGWTIGRRGYISMPMYGYALALFARERGEDRPDWVKILRPDVRQAFEQGCRYLESEESESPDLPAASNPPPRCFGGDAPSDFAGEPEPVPDSVEAGNEVARCAFCGAELSESADSEPVCSECERSVEENDRALQAAAEQEEAGYRAKTRVARRTCLLMALACVALVLWQLIRVAFK